MDIKKFFKNIIYIIALFGVSGLFILFNIYDENASAVFSFFVLIGAAVLINGFSLMAIRTKNVFYSVSDLVCFALWLYPLYGKAQNLLPEGTGIWAYLLILTAFLPAIACCLYTIMYHIIIDLKKKKAGRKALTAKKVLSIISIVITLVSAIFLILSAVKLATQIPKDIEQRKQNYSDTVNMAKEMAQKYKDTDLVLEEILDKYELTYDNSNENVYIIEELDEVSMIIKTTKDEDDNLSGTINVSCDNIGFIIPNYYAWNIYNGEESEIPLNIKPE